MQEGGSFERIEESGNKDQYIVARPTYLINIKWVSSVSNKGIPIKEWLGISSIIRTNKNIQTLIRY
jgi:hypothetical protein